MGCSGPAEAPRAFNQPITVPCAGTHSHRVSLCQRCAMATHLGSPQAVQTRCFPHQECVDELGRSFSVLAALESEAVMLESQRLQYQSPAGQRWLGAQ